MVQDGELLSGSIDDNAVKAAEGGLVHICWTELGPAGARDLFNNTQLIVNHWFLQNGYTVGVSDIVANSETIRNIQHAIEEIKKEVSFPPISSPLTAQRQTSSPFSPIQRLPLLPPPHSGTPRYGTYAQDAASPGTRR